MDYGKRSNGTPKGKGYFGEIKAPWGKISTEISIGVNIDGKEIEIPSLVPTLDKSEIDYLIKGGKPTKAIIDKAVEHAKKRTKENKSPFAQEGEQASYSERQLGKEAGRQMGANNLSQYDDLGGFHANEVKGNIVKK